MRASCSANLRSKTSSAPTACTMKPIWQQAAAQHLLRIALTVASSARPRCDQHEGASTFEVLQVHAAFALGAGRHRERRACVACRWCVDAGHHRVRNSQGRQSAGENGRSRCASEGPLSV